MAVPIVLSDDDELEQYRRGRGARRGRRRWRCGLGSCWRAAIAAEQPNSKMRKTSGQGQDALCSVSFVGTREM
jgi:hypothetical protein